MNTPYDKIVLVSLDTLRSDCIDTNPFKLFPGEYSVKNTLQRSRLDDLLDQSTFFANTISVAPYTSASHAAYFSGKWQKHNGVYDQFNSKLKAKTIFEMADEQGYETIFKTDFPLVLGKYLNLSRGVDHYYIEDDEAALAQLKGSSKALAFFHFGQIHYPYGFHSLKYGGRDYEEKVIALERKYNITPGAMKLDDMAIETFRDEKDLKLLFRYKTVVSYLYRNKLDDDLFDLYIEGINYFHQHKFNAFLDKLLTLLDGKRFLVVIFGDHGEAWNNETYGHHNASDEGVLRVPLLFYAKDIEAQIFSSRVRTVDLFPTLLDAMGNIKGSFDGKTLSEIIYNKRAEPHRDAFSAVWVNELQDIIKKTDSILSSGNFKTSKRHSIKYNACYYEGDYKYVRSYKRFVDRSERLAMSDSHQLFNVGDVRKVQLAQHDKQHEQYMQARLDEYNDIAAEQHDTPEQLREYFKLQGYNI